MLLYLHYKRNRELVLCVYGMIMHLGNAERILEKPIKHSAMPRQRCMALKALTGLGKSKKTGCIQEH